MTNTKWWLRRGNKGRGDGWVYGYVGVGLEWILTSGNKWWRALCGCFSIEWDGVYREGRGKYIEGAHMYGMKGHRIGGNERRDI